MYRFDSYIKDFLYGNNSISLEGIGEFTLATGAAPDNNSAASATAAIQFQQNKRALTTEAFINYVAEKEGKNKRLVASDIESFLGQTRQFINIGRPFSIDGVGVVQLGKNWQYEFIENISSESKENESAKKHREKPVHKYAEKVKKTGIKRRAKSNLNFVVLIITLIIVAGIIASIYYYMSQSNVNISSFPTQGTIADTLNKNSKNTGNATAKNDSTVYRFVFETTYSTARAYKRYGQLVKLSIGVNMDSLMTNTTIHYKLYVAKKLLPADTSAVKDSLSVYFGKPVRIEQ